MTIVEQDAAAAARIKPELDDRISEIGDARGLIRQELSGFNSPGLDRAYTTAISNGTGRSRFDAVTARNVLDDYYEAKAGHRSRYEGTTAGADFRAAQRIRPELDQTFTRLASGSRLIRSELSSFNAPGEHKRYIDAIKRQAR
jgi:hypothetical protein